MKSGDHEHYSNFRPQEIRSSRESVVVKAIDTEEEYDHIVDAVEHLMDKGEEHLSTEESALLETMAVLVQALR